MKVYELINFLEIKAAKNEIEDSFEVMKVMWLSLNEQEGVAVEGVEIDVNQRVVLLR